MSTSLTPQEIVDKAMSHIFEQGARALALDRGPIDGFCMYRAPDGRKCAIGALIPDSLIPTGGIEIGDIRTVMERFPEIKSYLNPTGSMAITSLLSRLQHLHDAHLFPYVTTEKMQNAVSTFLGNFEKTGLITLDNVRHMKFADGRDNEQTHT